MKRFRREERTDCFGGTAVRPQTEHWPKPMQAAPKPYLQKSEAIINIYIYIYIYI